MAEGEPDIAQLESRIGYAFSDKNLLFRALTHPSRVHMKKGGGHYQRLEFLGDAVLGLVLANSLYHGLPEEREGALTRYRSMLAKGDQLYQLAIEIELGQYLRLADAEVEQGGREKPSILEDALEAIIGAVYLDGGLESATSCVEQLYGSLKNRVDQQLENHNPKGKLQELHQPELGNDSIEYRLVESSGPDHQKTFTVEVWVDGTCRGCGTGNSKKSAEEAAARAALDGSPTE